MFLAAVLGSSLLFRSQQASRPVPSWTDLRILSGGPGRIPMRMLYNFSDLVCCAKVISSNTIASIDRFASSQWAPKSSRMKKLTGIPTSSLAIGLTLPPGSWAGKVYMKNSCLSNTLASITELVSFFLLHQLLREDSCQLHHSCSLVLSGSSVECMLVHG